MTLCTHGWVEAKYLCHTSDADWREVACFNFCAQEYELLSWLFGVKDHVDFEVLAPERGLPSDASSRVRREAKQKSYAGGHSWVTWKELKDVDWQEGYLVIEESPYEGHEEYWKEELERSAKEPEREDGKTWLEKGTVYYQYKFTRRHTIDRIGTVILDVMEAIAKTCGDENVRFVAWFDD
jgi:hypothetical protein